MKSLHYIIILTILLASCKSDPVEEIIPFENQKITAKEKIKLALNDNYLESLGCSTEDIEFLNEFYSNRNYAPVWMNDTMLTEFGVEMKKVLSNTTQLGIPEGRIVRTNGDNFVKDEILNSKYYSLVVSDLKNGIINFKDTTKRSLSHANASFLDSTLTFNDSVDLRLQFLKFGPADTAYQVLGAGLIHLFDTYPMDTNSFTVESIKVDTLQAINKATKALISKGYLKSDTDSTAFQDALKTFQEGYGLNPDGVIGKYTSKALNESTTHRRDRIILAMDKIRSKRNYPNKYIHINIPEYKLRFYINDSLKSEHNIVVGKYENQTPELTSSLRKIVAYPYWNVPYSISSKEILPAVKRNVGYLAKHNYKVYRKGELVDPYTVDWKSIRQNAFPFKIVQDPGPRNSLGIIKFDFPNAHSVYFHDTPSKSLFGADVRAYSHGCMRTQNPLDLATKILERDQVGNKLNEVLIPDSLDSIMARGKNFEIKLLERIPVYIEYQTVTRNGTEMITYVDIYGRDEEYLKIMRE